MERIIKKIKFAWLPVRLTDGSWVWLKKYIEKGKLIYPKGELPAGVDIPGYPFYAKIKTYKYKK